MYGKINSFIERSDIIMDRTRGMDSMVMNIQHPSSCSCLKLHDSSRIGIVIVSHTVDLNDHVVCGTFLEVNLTW